MVSYHTYDTVTTHNQPTYSTGLIYIHTSGNHSDQLRIVGLEEWHCTHQLHQQHDSRSHHLNMYDLNTFWPPEFLGVCGAVKAGLEPHGYF